MAKQAVTRTSTTPKGSSTVVTYTLRNMPRATWNRFRARLVKEGRSVTYALNKLIEDYGNAPADE